MTTESQVCIVIPYEILERGLEDRYIELIEVHGNSPRMAEMLAMRQAPRVMTDDVMLGGVGYLCDQVKDPQQLESIVAAARRHGYNPKPTDFYNPALARFRGDPEAFLNHGQGRGHVTKMLEKRGWAADGMVQSKGRQAESDPHKNPKRLSDKIVERNRKKKIEQNPDLAHSDQRELVESIVDKHGWNETR